MDDKEITEFLVKYYSSNGNSKCIKDILPLVAAHPGVFMYFKEHKNATMIKRLIFIQYIHSEYFKLSSIEQLQDAFSLKELLTVLNDHPEGIQYLRPDYRFYNRLITEVLMKNPNAIRYIKDPTREQKELAIRGNAKTIYVIRNLTTADINLAQKVNPDMKCTLVLLKKDLKVKCSCK